MLLSPAMRSTQEWVYRPRHVETCAFAQVSTLRSFVGWFGFWGYVWLLCVWPCIRVLWSWIGSVCVAAVSKRLGSLQFGTQLWDAKECEAALPKSRRKWREQLLRVSVMYPLKLITCRCVHSFTKIQEPLKVLGAWKVTSPILRIRICNKFSRVRSTEPGMCASLI
jgi:hypothetical protein